MNYRVLQPFDGHQVGALTDLVGQNVDYRIAAGHVEIVADDDNDAKPEQKSARTVSKKRKD